MREQEGWEQHVAFMDALADEGFIVLGGPLGNDDQALHVIDAESEGEIEERLEAARRQKQLAGEFSYLIVNDDLDRAVTELETVVRKEIAATHT